MIWRLICVLALCWLANCDVKRYEFNVSYGLVNVDGSKERQVVLINGAWPAPGIRVDKGDRVLVNVTNWLDEEIAVHFHGILQKGTNDMDGAMMLTQCGIPTGGNFLYNFTVDQPGSYWYHSHSMGQYGDGLRGAFVVNDPDVPFQYDHDVYLTVSDWYHKTAPELIAEDRFLRGSEPNIESSLFNETAEGDWSVEEDSTYYLRIINVGMSAPQFLYIEGHKLTIVEVDGVYVEPVKVETVYLTSGQRYGVLLKTRAGPEKNFRIVQILQKMMSTITTEHWLVYDDALSFDAEAKIKTNKEVQVYNDVDLIPLDPVPVYEKVDKQIYLQFAMEDSHYSFNHNPYENPQVPSLYSVMSASNDTVATSETTYAEASNPYVIERGDVVEIIVDSKHDMMRHPFHLHGHNFQVLYHGKDYKSMEIPKYPMIRDTMNLLGYSQIVLRFRADNPGVWIFHCHIDWHLIQGLGITLIEDPAYIREHFDIPVDRFETCASRLATKTEVSTTQESTTQFPAARENVLASIVLLTFFAGVLVFYLHSLRK